MMMIYLKYYLVFQLHQKNTVTYLIHLMSKNYASSDSPEVITHKVEIKSPTGFQGSLSLRTIWSVEP